MSNQNTFEGVARSTGGALQEGLGKAMDDTDMQVKGEAKQVEGSIQKTYGQSLAWLDTLVASAQEKPLTALFAALCTGYVLRQVIHTPRR